MINRKGEEGEAAGRVGEGSAREACKDIPLVIYTALASMFL